MTADPYTTDAVLDVEAVLFDMDGTLVDSTQVVESLWAQFANRYGVELPILLAYSHGRQTRDTVVRFLPPGHDPDKVTVEFQQKELTRTSGITEIRGARKLLGQLDGARTAVVTSAPRDLAERRLAAAGLPIPAVLVTGEDVASGKPDPAGYHVAARRLGVSPYRCLVFEDAEAGIRAGLASGAHTLVVGAHRSPATRDLQRIPDLSVVSATVSDRGGISLRWPRIKEAQPLRKCE